MKDILLGSGLRMPAMGYGVGTAWFRASEEKEVELKKCLTAALDAGFRHIDDAEMYQNEKATGEAIAQWVSRTGVAREQLFITGKVMSVDDPGVLATCRCSLERSGLSYYDLYLVHAPFQQSGQPFQRSLKEIWAEMETLVDQGLVRAIGVSNWRVCDLEDIFADARVKPVCNQIEAHPYLQQIELLRWCQNRGVVVAAYGPLIPVTREELRGGPVDLPVMAAASRLGKTPAQVLLRWSLQTGRAVITTTGKPERLPQLLEVSDDFELTAEELAAISAAGASRSEFRAFWPPLRAAAA
eukprot:CAMPEP_0115068630 /NCGR_PEP_ID=MMETSP0227-20121206/12085_1 /TAXON_ID=89957 /ORGANISM="Polarella glacialis, Strain CCMP 1383" /LENGTH=297 /DNA_ID=CAMNT_0002454895 /DNA_START=120 /DNA_END=1013 /DNA_ORIENTATION=+